MPFTIKFLDTLKPREKPYREFEGEARAGFGVQVSSGGKISFIYLYRRPQDKKQSVMTLGAYLGIGRDGKAKDGGITLKEAYDQYAYWKRIRDGGRDPQDMREEELTREYSVRQAEATKRKQEAMQGNIQQLLMAYTDDLHNRGKRSWSAAQKLFDTNVYKHIPIETKAKSVTPDSIKVVLAEVIQRDALIAANRLRAYLSAAFAFGIGWDNDPNRHFEPLRFGIGANPVRDVPKPVRSEKPRDRALSEKEVKQVWDYLDNTKFHPKTVAAIRLLFALGGQRIEDVLALNSNEVDFTNRLVTFNDTKNGTTHVIPFGDVAEPLLQSCVLNADSSGALFGKIRGNKGIIDSSTLSHAITKLTKRTGLEPFQPKDVRRTVKTLMGFAGIRKEDRDRFQNHALTDVSSRHYDRYDYLVEKRQVMAVWDEYLKRILAGNPQATVVQLRATSS